MEVDLERLVHGNTLGRKIAAEMGYKKTKYWKFLSDNCFSKVNPAVAANIDDIIYAKKVAEYYFCQYKGLICRETKKLRFLSEEERFSIGYEAMWRSLHEYRDIKTNITEWLMFGLKIYVTKARYKRRDKDLSLTVKGKFVDDKKQKMPLDLVINRNEDVILSSWERKAGIRGEEKIIFDFYMTRASSNAWIQDYLKDLKERTGETRTKARIIQKMQIIKKKLAEAIKKEGVDLPVAL